MSSTIFFFLFIPLLAFILLAVNLIFAPHNPYMEKNNVFECGFSSFLGQNRTQFSISFFIFALLFLLFDLEILLVYPYLVSAYTNGIYGLTILLLFLLALTLGFAFELGKKALSIDSRQMSNVSIVNSKYISKLSSNSNFIFLFMRNEKKRSYVTTTLYNKNKYEFSYEIYKFIYLTGKLFYDFFKLFKLIFKSPLFIKSHIHEKITNYILDCFFKTYFYRNHLELYDKHGLSYLLNKLANDINCFFIEFLRGKNNILLLLVFYVVCINGLYSNFTLFFYILLFNTVFLSFLSIITVYKNKLLKESYPLLFWSFLGMLSILFLSLLIIIIYSSDEILIYLEALFVYMKSFMQNSSGSSKDNGGSNKNPGPDGPRGPNDSPFPYDPNATSRSEKREDSSSDTEYPDTSSAYEQERMDQDWCDAEACIVIKPNTPPYFAKIKDVIEAKRINDEIEAKRIKAAAKYDRSKAIRTDQMRADRAYSDKLRRTGQLPPKSGPTLRNRRQLPPDSDL